MLVAANDGVGTKVKIAIDQRYPLAEAAQGKRVGEYIARTAIELAPDVLSK